MISATKEPQGNVISRIKISLNIWKIWIILLLLLQGADEKMNPLFENQGGQNRLNNGNTSNSDMCCIIDKYRISNERP